MKRLFTQTCILLLVAIPVFSQDDIVSSDAYIPIWENPDVFYEALRADAILAAYLHESPLDLTVKIDKHGKIVNVWSETALNPIILERLASPLQTIRYRREGDLGTAADKELSLYIKQFSTKLPPRKLSEKQLTALLLESIILVEQTKFESAAILLSGVIWNLDGTYRTSKLASIYQKAKLYRGFSRLYLGNWSASESDLTEVIGSQRINPSPQIQIGQLIMARGFVRAQQGNHTAAFADWLILARAPQSDHLLWFSNLFGQELSQPAIDQQVEMLLPLFERSQLSSWLSTILTDFQELGPTGFVVMGMP